MATPTPKFLVFYRDEQLPELTSAVILKNRFPHADPVAMAPGKSLPIPESKDNDIEAVIYGSYYTEENISQLATALPGPVTVHMYDVDAKGRYPSLREDESVYFDDVPAEKQSYAGYTWDHYCKEAIAKPRALELIDIKGRARYDLDSDMRPFIEWLYVAGMTFQRINDLLFTDKYDICLCVRDGTYYQKKSDSLVSSIAETAGWFKMKSTGIRVAIVDATRQIELVGEELCKRGADVVFIARYVYKERATRFTTYTTNPNISAVDLNKSLGYNAGGSKKSSGFVTKDSEGLFIEKHLVDLE